jgi:copper chaperone CopZ
MPTTETTLTVKGMSCGGCVRSVTAVIGAVPGAEPIEVEIGRARVRIDPSRASATQVREALARAGYEATEQ